MGITEAYQTTLDYLYHKLPVFSLQGKSALKHDLTNIRKLCTALGNPQEQFRSIHIAGTNGKGSTSHAIAAILQHAGYKTGLYTSPHLVDFRERILIGGLPIGREWVVSFMERYQELIEEVQPSFFEVTVAMAFKAFAETETDIAVIEAGLGGRLDSTNIITPLLSVITNISFDHKDILGHTLKEIASEKAGIIKPGVPVLIGEQHPETTQVFFQKAVQQHSTVYYAEAHWELVNISRNTAEQRYYKAVHSAHRHMYELHTDLQGDYQRQNIKTALAATEILIASCGLHLTIPEALAALASVKQSTSLRGRWEYLSAEPIIIVDVAHNHAGISIVLAQWERVSATKKHIIAGFVKDKELDTVLPLFPSDTVLHCCHAGMARALPAAELAALASAKGKNAQAHGTVEKAMQAVLPLMEPGDALLITGSFFVAGEAISIWEKQTIC